MTKIKTFLIFFFIINLALVLFYKTNYPKIEDIKPINLNKTHICACDSMIIIHYNGPKAQIIWKDNSRSYYCEVREIFYEIISKIKKKNIKKIFVQDFSNLEWGSYIDKWILADSAYYVIDSNKEGAMGVTYVPFSTLKTAEIFQKENGGIIVQYNQITDEVLQKSNDILKKKMF